MVGVKTKVDTAKIASKALARIKGKHELEIVEEPKKRGTEKETIPVKERYIKSHNELMVSAPKSAKIRKREKRYWLAERVWIEKPEGFKLINVIVLALIAVFTLSALSLSYRASRIEIRPFIPEDQATLNISDIEFHWESSTEKIDYLIQVETNGKRILECYTRENRYVPTLEEMRLFKPGYHYQWRVIPISAKRRALGFKTNDREFMVSLETGY